MNGLPFQPGQRVETNKARQAQADEAAKKLSAQARDTTNANRFRRLTVDAASAAYQAKYARINAMLR
jgi:hypothetical protein